MTRGEDLGDRVADAGTVPVLRIPAISSSRNLILYES